jgi:hypothetical protein
MGLIDDEDENIIYMPSSYSISERRHKTMKNNSDQTKAYTFDSDNEREIAVCIAIQKLGKASIEEIIDFIIKLNARITEKQVTKCAENLRAKNLLSVDLSEKGNNGISIKRYLMKKIKLAIPEVAQMKDLVHDESLKPLIDELDRSKGTQKKGLKQYDYYDVEVTFDIDGRITGFVPNEDGVLVHYRDNDGNIVFYHYHFKNWMRSNLPLINRSPSFIGDIFFSNGKTNIKKGDIDEKYVTNIDSGFSSSRGTGGRGTRKSEYLPKGTKVVTSFTIQRDQIAPSDVQSMFDLICRRGVAFGGNHKLSTGRLVNPQVKILSEQLWGDKD